ncbi:helicase associated domain-containing protein [Arthrobacter rhombi]|uniref:helicase associated domain-containing protein n=1 Tax=Arthrobacter rhombi TaxID=71253 RepID=UPI003FD29DC5
MTRDKARRGEWLLMYTQGLEPAEIARICHTLPHTATAHITEQVAADPSLLDRRLCRCLEPSMPVFREADATRGWEGNALSLTRFVERHGRLPRRSADTTETAGALEVFLYHWVRAQRAASAEGLLPSRRERRLEEIAGWVVLGREQLHAKHWDERLAACIAFHDEHDRIPSFKYGTSTLERSLGSWLARQRTRARRGTLPAARARALQPLLIPQD